VSKDTILIRADANVAIGTGHVMRCLALAQAWQDAGGHAIFAFAETTASLVRRLQDESIEIQRIEAQSGDEEDAGVTVGIANATNPDWIVVDGYHFGADYQEAIRSSMWRILFVDDNGHARRYSANVVLNQNSHASEGLYVQREPYTRLLLGPRYAMLRREFRASGHREREIRGVGNRILLAMGGSDPENLTRRIIAALENVHEFRLEIVAVVGGSNPHLEDIEDGVAGSRHHIRVARNATDMPGLMAWADLAISAAGSICWEFCALGLPALLIPVASNQVASADCLQRIGAAKLFSGGPEFCPDELVRAAIGLITCPSERISLSQRAHALVDAKGAERVVAALHNETKQTGEP
jgi:UDP-2,4-diacetamido-2,4,6-trideoxy-beta-L-altropyranose hydrolase